MYLLQYCKTFLTELNKFDSRKKTTFYLMNIKFSFSGMALLLQNYELYNFNSTIQWNLVITRFLGP